MISLWKIYYFIVYGNTDGIDRHRIFQTDLKIQSSD